MSERTYSKRERFEEFLKRLAAAPSPSTLEEALEQLGSILNQVEDDLTSIPFHPKQWMTDGRMYPPQRDSERSVPDHPLLRRFRSRAHNTYLGENGAVQIVTATESPVVLFDKPGADGRGVEDL